MARMLLLLFWASVAGSYVLAVFPLPVPELGSHPDKANHIAAFGAMALFGALAYPAAPLHRLAAGLAAYGLMIEATQLVPALNRHADIADWIADLAGVAVGIGLARALPASWRQLARPPDCRKSP